MTVLQMQRILVSDEEKEERAALNHTCDGITVSEVNLPWYVQFRVSSGDSYQFTNESDAMIFQSMNLNSGILRIIQNTRSLMEIISVSLCR